MSLNDSTLASNIVAFGAEKQHALFEQRVSIFGQNEVSDYLTMLLTGLGVGEILIQGSRTESGLKVFAKDIDINPQTRIHRHNGRAIMSRHSAFDPTITLNVEGDESYFAENQEKVSNLVKTESLIHIPQKSHSQPFTSLLTASLLTEQIRKKTFLYYPSEKLFLQETLESPQLFANQNSFHHATSKHTLLIGAGGIGTYASLTLANSAIEKVTIIDYDVIEPQNLNRQLLYLGEVGEQKAQTLASKLSAIKPNTTWVGQDMRIESQTQLETYLKKHDVDQVFCATDNFESRLIVSSACESLTIPVIEGGCNSTSAIVSQYEPHKTNPIHITRKFSQYAKAARPKEEPLGCMNAVNPSVVIPNAIAGVMMYATSMSRSHTADNKREYLNGTLLYNPLIPSPFWEKSQ